jgi:hypothetical protein
MLSAATEQKIERNSTDDEHEDDDSDADDVNVVEPD